jgi:hypothetical protein
MQYVFFCKKLKYSVLRNQCQRPNLKTLEHSCGEYIGIIGHWKWHLIGFKESSVSQLGQKITCATKFFDSFGCLLSKI